MIQCSFNYYNIWENRNKHILITKSEIYVHKFLTCYAPYEWSISISDFRKGNSITDWWLDRKYHLFNKKKLF